MNERWELLRVRALDIQTNIHVRLAELQLEKVDELKTFLTQTEDRISRMSDIGPAPDDLRQQMEAHNVLQKDLEKQQTLVESLSNLVIIEDSDYFRDLEDKLAALEERWSHVVKWTTNRWEKLQKLSQKWTQLSEKYRVITEWMDARENNLKTMEAKEVVEIGAVMERIKSLQYCQNDLNELIKHLNTMEETAQSLSDENLSSLNVLDKVENLNDRSDALKLILEVQQMRLESMGFQIQIGQKEMKKLEVPSNWEDFQKKIENPSQTTTSDSFVDVEMAAPVQARKNVVESSVQEKLNEQVLYYIKLNFNYKLIVINIFVGDGNDLFRR